MAVNAPYRLQIFLPTDMRDALRDLAHEERTSLQDLVSTWLLDKIRSYDRYATFQLTSDEETAATRRI